MGTQKLNRSELMKRAWDLKRRVPAMSFGECLKWSWSKTGCVFGREEKAVQTTEFVLTDNFMDMVA